jgi:hypothetical protein
LKGEVRKMTDNEIEKIIDAYCKNNQDKPDHWINLCKKHKTSISDAIDIFCDKGLKNGHIARRTKDELNDLRKMLKSIEPEIQGEKTFDGLLQCISRKKINGIGPLTLYDAALLLWASKGFDLDTEPKYVYVHAGVITGLQTILGYRSPKERYEKNELGYFAKTALSPAHLESLLCIYKNGLDR